MKRLLFLIILFSIGSTVSAQDPDPDLFQTWYLTDMYIQFGPPFDLMEPPVFATLTISKNFDFSGQGSCNTFTGSYTYDPVLDSFFYDEFEATTEDCVFPYHNNFEHEYFEDVRGQWEYEIVDDGVGLQLHIFDVFELSATFTNYPLYTPDIGVINIAIYPNPVNDILNISSEHNDILSLILYGIDGKEIYSIYKFTHGIKEINLEKLDSGVYFVEIQTDLGKVTKKIIKN
tara:strand:- start:154 stop:846 length:693 start_codon:yes stop_codon:yes gene_type:complete